MIPKRPALYERIRGRKRVCLLLIDLQKGCVANRGEEEEYVAMELDKVGKNVRNLLKVSRELRDQVEIIHTRIMSLTDE
jgi:nicotinamidase-related amidase